MHIQTATAMQTPWLDIVAASRWLGYPCLNGRAPNSVYDIAQQIGHRVNGQWRIHRDDLDAYIRSH